MRKESRGRLGSYMCVGGSADWIDGLWVFRGWRVGRGAEAVRMWRGAFGGAQVVVLIVGRHTCSVGALVDKAQLRATGKECATLKGN